MVGAMEIKQGFKKTEAGIIPSDWDVVKLKNLLIEKLQNGVFYKPSKKGIGIKLINVGDLYKGIPLNTDELELFDASIDEEKRFKVIDGDIFFTRSSVVPSGIAHCNIYVETSPVKVVFDSHVIKARPNKKLVFPSYFYRYCSSVARHYLISHAKTAIMTTIDQGVIEKCPIALPPTLAEQTAIATALNDADALITQLEKLVNKKRAIRKGAMQELLKPKEGWVEKTVGEVATLKARIGWQGLTTAEYRKSGDYFLITGTEFKNGFIDWESCFYVDAERYKQDKYIQVKEHDVLVTKDGTIGKVAFIKSVPKPATLNSGVFVIRPTNNSFHPEFFYYLLLSEVFLIFLSQLSAGSTIIHLYQKDFVTFKFSTPKTLEEQIRIAKILSDMDAEIEALEKKLEKYKKIKQGMIQELLTGRIRLI